VSRRVVAAEPRIQAELTANPSRANMEDHTSGNSTPSSGETAGLTAKMLATRAAAAALSVLPAPGCWLCLLRSNYRHLLTKCRASGVMLEIERQNFRTREHGPGRLRGRCHLAGQQQSTGAIDHRRYHGRYRRRYRRPLDQPHLASLQLARAERSRLVCKRKRRWRDWRYESGECQLDRKLRSRAA
jgi:hypothetical protein